MVFPQNATGKLGHPFARVVTELDVQKARTTAKLSHHALKCDFANAWDGLVGAQHLPGRRAPSLGLPCSGLVRFVVDFWEMVINIATLVVVPGEDDAIPTESSTRGIRVAAHTIDSFQYALARIITEVGLLFDASAVLV